MSAVTDYLDETIRPLCNTFFTNNASKFDLTEQEGCGRYTEALVNYLRGVGHNEVGHLRKHGTATQYNGHAIDAFLYNVPDPTLLRAVDVIASAEAKPPYTPSHQPPSAGFGIDEPRYTASDWFLVDGGGTVPGDVVPWVGYDEHGFEEVKRQLAYDYARRPQGADFDVMVWGARVFHSQYMGPDKRPLGQTAALLKHRPEWCAALTVPVIPVPPGWKIGDPV